MKIYVIGNPLVPNDRASLILIPALQSVFPLIDFCVVDPNENFPPKNERNLVILDTVQGIRKPMKLRLEDMEVRTKTPVTPHDYDLMMHLLLLQKMRRVDTVIIVGVPEEMKRSQTEELTRLIADISRST